MPNPTRRHSKSRGAKRRTHYKAVKPTVASCPNCSELKLTHCICPNCGYYNGRYIISASKQSQ